LHLEEASVKSGQTLFMGSKSPWHDASAAACLDALMTFAVFDQPVVLFLHGEGVLQLLRQQDGTGLGLKTLARTFGALTLYGVEEVLVDEVSLKLLGLSRKDLIEPGDTENPDSPFIIRALSRKELGLVLARSNVVFNF
jgi:tRNA 2-thiouridine synthesizing protein C